MKNTLLNIWNFYLEGFRSMTLGRTLWLIILVKLFIMFFILKIFFFPNFLGHLSSDKEKANTWAKNLFGGLFRRRIDYALFLLTFITPG